MTASKTSGHTGKNFHKENGLNGKPPGIEAQEPVIFHVERSKESGEIISKLITSVSCVFEDALVNEVADAMGHNEEIFAIAVTDRSLHPRGIVLRKDLFDILGKPYCRDAYHRKHISKLMKKAEIFSENSSIFSIIDHVAPDLQKPSNTFYMVIDAAGKIRGIISTRRILGYLSDISRKDIHLAKKVQTSIVKEQTHIKRERLEFLAFSQMAGEVGGDYYYIREYKTGKWIIAICDVSGKGISASLITTALGGMFSTFDFNRGIKSFVNTVNHFFIETFYMEKYVTAIIMEFNESTGEVIICDMGHKHIFIERGGRILRLQTNDINLPIGIIPEQEVVFNRLSLKRGEMIVLMTDGLCEQKNEKGDEYPLKRFADITKTESRNGLEAVKNMILGDLNAFRGGRMQGDDITLLMIKFPGVKQTYEINPHVNNFQSQTVENMAV